MQTSFIEPPNKQPLLHSFWMSYFGTRQYTAFIQLYVQVIKCANLVVCKHISMCDCCLTVYGRRCDNSYKTGIILSH